MPGTQCRSSKETTIRMQTVVGRNQPSGTSRRWQESKQVFQHGEAGRTHGGHGEGKYRVSRKVRSRLARSASFLLLRVLARPPCFSVLRDLLACLLAYLAPAARCRNRWGLAGQREEGWHLAGRRTTSTSWRERTQTNVLSALSRENPRVSRGFLRLGRVQSDRKRARLPHPRRFAP